MGVMMGGRAAEELIFGPSKVTAGASSDLQQATNLARKMIQEWGLSSLGLSVLESPLSNEKRAMVDAEVSRVVDESYQRALKLLSEEKRAHLAIAAALETNETLSRNDMLQILKENPTDIELPNATVLVDHDDP